MPDGLSNEMVLDREALAEALGLDGVTQLAGMHSEWIEAAIRTKQLDRRVEWTQGIAVGSREFVERVEAGLGVRGWYRYIQQATGDGFTLHEPSASFGVHFGA